MNEREFLSNIKEQLEYLLNHGKNVNVIFIAKVDDGWDDRSETYSVLNGKYDIGANMLLEKLKEKTYFKSCVEYALAQLPSRTSPAIRFTADELDIIRDALGEMLLCVHKEFHEIKEHTYDDFLPIINKIQAHLLCPEFRDVKQFVNNVSGTWCEIIEEGGEA